MRHLFLRLAAALTVAAAALILVPEAITAPTPTLLGGIHKAKKAKAAKGKKAKKGKKGKKGANKLEAKFKQLDTNNDGKLSKEEFQKRKELKKAKKANKQKTAKAGKKANKQKTAKAGKGKKGKKGGLFARLDTDKDGYLSLDEFKKMREMKKERKAARAQKKAGKGKKAAS